MRVRRETGDFSIKLVNNTATIRKNLSAEDLLGYVVETHDGPGYTLTIITSVTATENSVMFKIGADSFTYTPSTGVVAKQA